MDKLVKSQAGRVAPTLVRPPVFEADTIYGDRPQPLQTTVLDHMVTRMQRTHERRRAAMFVGPAGIGKTTAVEAFRCANADHVIVINVLKRGVTGTQILQQVLRALRLHNGRPIKYITNATEQIWQQLAVEIEHYGQGLPRDARPDLFPLLTIVFDEAQRLTNAALDALRGYNEPHYLCTGTFPLGLIFVGNNELSLEDRGGGSILDEGMRDRLLYADRLNYKFITPEDIASFSQARGITDKSAQKAIAQRFSGERIVRSYRQIERFIDDCNDEAGGGPVTAAIVLSIATL